jgi:lipoprotein-anchoring transpeptidase ErfK/SrfK
MRRVMPLLLASTAGAALLCLFSIPAQAQAYFMGQPAAPARTARAPVESTGSVTRPGSLGGGFIEFLMTGVDPTPGARQQPYAIQQPARGQRGPEVDPFTGEPTMRGQRRMAALQPRGDFERPIERVLDPRFHKQEVAYDGPHRPGTIVIDTPNKFLFLVLEGGRALRYGIGVGRPGFEWAGVKSVTRKAEWPDWTPPAAMLKRRPDLPRFMAGGPDNPMGARALYLGSSLYRIHGTNEPHTIGQAVSSGCIRMTNDDVKDLYERVRVGMRVIVI